MRQMIWELGGVCRLRMLTGVRAGVQAILLVLLVALGGSLSAQTGGQGAIQGTVTDATGAVVPNATVTALNQASGVSTVRTSSSSGLYEFNPLLPGTYTVTVSAAGFQTSRQENLAVDALRVTGLNLMLMTGSTNTEVTVTEAPPALETTNATLSGVMENETYQNLPIQMSGQQRDATAFATLMPGTVPGARTPIIGGTGNYLAEISVDGIPLTTANQQGDNRTVFNSVPVEAVDQFQVLTSTPPVEYQGAGLLNFTIKSGGNKYHGTVADFIRNTIFDTWGFTAPAATQKNAAGQTVPAPKPVEHQNELVAAVGGPIPATKNKGFFFFTYDRYHGRAGVRPGTLNVATNKMRNGDFSELIAPGGPGIVIYDPTTQAACTAANAGKPCRFAFPNNVIPASKISPIAQYMQKFVPEPTNGNLTGNYLGGVPTGYDNWSYVFRVDYDLTAKQRLSFVASHGNRLNVPFTVGANPTLPPPLTNGALARVIIHIGDVEHAYQISDRLVNQFKFGYVYMGGPPIQNTSVLVPGSSAASAGITNLPAGQASDNFPYTSFTGTNAPQNYQNGASTATQTSVAETFTILDNLHYTRGKHSVTAGFQYQFLESNAAAATGPSSILSLTYGQNETGSINTAGTGINTNTGYSYASYLLGATNSGSTSVQPFSALGGRYRPFSPYVQDDWKVTSRLTVNIGLRWDLLPPFHEVLDRFTYLNPDLTNPITGNKGALEFAGNRGPLSCNCRTPVNTYYKNWGPRVGFAYSIGDKTVVRGGYGLVYSHGGGVGGRVGASNGPGQLGFTASAAITAPSNIAPAFYLNNSPGMQAAGLANSNYGGPNYTLPTPPGVVPSAVALGTGNYYTGNTLTQATTTLTYADPYFSGRAPEVSFFNFGVQRAISNALTLSVNYAGSSAHFLVTGGSNPRGYWANQMDPKYLVLGSLLNAPATAANIAAAAAIVPGIAAPYPSYVNPAGTINSAATISKMLTAFPQYNSVSDIWGQNVGNNSYNSLQLSLNQRPWHGLTYTVNYTYAKGLGDDGTFRSGFNIPASALSTGHSYQQDRIERSWSSAAVPQALAIFGVYQSPIGRGKAFSDNVPMRLALGGWQLSGIFTYRSGTPLLITYAGCGTNQPGQGQCMPDYNPNFSGSPRINGSWGKGVTAANLGAVSFIDANAFVAPQPFKLGNVARSRPLDLQNPSAYNLDASIRRSFNLTAERFRLIFQADCLNVTNKVTFGGIGSVWSPSSPTSAFGKVSSVSNSSRDWQLSGRINF